MHALFLSESRMVAQRGTIPSLDGLRAISILLVLAAHFIDDRLFPGGLGVYVFFVISGFLITRLLLAEHKTTGHVSLPSFYFRRVLRLFPVIIVFTLVILGLHLWLGRPIDLLEPASGLAYFANYLYAWMDRNGVATQMPFGIFWSLSVEEHFYILFPVTLILAGANPRRLLWLLGGLCLGCLGLRCVMAAIHPEYANSLTFYTESQYRLDSIAFGVILALTCETAAGRRMIQRHAGPGAAIAGAAVLLGTLLVRDPWFRGTLRYSLQGVALAVIIAAVLFSPRLAPVQRILNTAVLVWIGRLSYSIYIWHEGVASFVPKQGLSHWQITLIDLSATLVVATVSYYGVEQPFLKLRHRLPHWRPAAPSGMAAQRLRTHTGV